MNRKKDSAKAAERTAKRLAAVSGELEVLSQVMMRREIEDVMEAEKDEAARAEKGQRKANLVGLRSPRKGDGKPRETGGVQASVPPGQRSQHGCRAGNRPVEGVGPQARF